MEGIRYANSLSGDDHHLFSFRSGSGRTGAEVRIPNRCSTSSKA